MQRFFRVMLISFLITSCDNRLDAPPTFVITLPPSVATKSPLPSPTVAAPPTLTRTVTPTLTLTPTLVPTLTPPPTPNTIFGPDEFPFNVNPLTGEALPDPALLNRRPLAIKISNYPDCVRPQHGLSLADLVFEHYAEGGSTRFTAIFYSRDAPQVGSIRSVRLIDLELPAMYRAALAFSGASDGVLRKLKEVDFKDWIISPEFEPFHPAFYRVARETLTKNCQRQEHTLFTGTQRLWDDANKKGINTRQELKGMRFDPVPPADGQPAKIVSATYSDSFAAWSYSEPVGRYFRYADGEPHIDALNSTHISAANVIIVFAHHQPTDILEDATGYDPITKTGGSYSLEVQLWGSGPALIVRDGLLYHATWNRKDRFGVLSFTDSSGKVFPLKPGTTWVELVNLTSPITQQNASWRIVPNKPTPMP